MESWMECTKGHREYIRCIDAAREIASGKLKDCKCGSKRHYFIKQTYPYDSETKVKTYKVEKVYRRFSTTKAEDEHWDPMIFCMSDEDGKIVFWPRYWILYDTGKWRYAQSSPLLRSEDLKEAISKLK